MVFFNGLSAFKRVLFLLTIFQVVLLTVGRPQTLKDVKRSDGELVTNAQRLKAGLPPLTPRNLYSPTRRTGGGGGGGNRKFLLYVITFAY